MRRIIPLELMGQEKLDYDLYDENGNVIYQNGSTLTPDILMSLNFKKVYTRSEQGIDDLNIKQEFETQISETAVKELLNSAKNILKSTEDGKAPNINACQKATDTIIEEVGEKLEQIDCIGQLRIFDEYTYSHTINVSTMSSAIAMDLGLPDDEIKELALGALLHDIGKMKIPKDILNKPGKLDPEEFDYMKRHTVLGYQIIKNEMKLSEKIALVALEHQEKYGGGGYPNKLKGKEITLFAQIASVADVYDALVSTRVYKKGMPSNKATEIMVSEGSASFNPYILHRFIKMANVKTSSGLLITDNDKV